MTPETDGLAGLETTFSKTVSESDVYLLSGITGDFSPIHIDEVYAKGTTFGGRLVQGALVIGLMMTAATYASERSARVSPSLGFDRIRHTAPTFIGDTLTVRYRVERVDSVAERGYAAVAVTNQRGETVAVATHVFWCGQMAEDDHSLGEVTK